MLGVLGVMPATASTAPGVAWKDARHRPAVSDACAATVPKASPGEPFVGAATNDLDQFDNTIGYRANLVVKYIDWGTPLPCSVAIDASSGVTTLLEVLPQYPVASGSHVSIRSIANGKHDRYLRTLGASLKAIPHKVLLSFAPEMDGDWYPWGYTAVSPREFVKAWKHVHNVISEADDRKNLEWVWQISHVDKPSTATSIAPLWPGKKYVDIVGLDSYYYVPTDSFEGKLSGTINDVRRFARHTPLLVAETGIGPRQGLGVGAGQSTVKMTDLFSGLLNNGVIGFVWFDYDEHDKPWPVVSVGGCTLNDTTTVSVPSGGFPGVGPGMHVVGLDVPQGAIVDSIAGNDMTLSVAASGSLTESLRFITVSTNHQDWELYPNSPGARNFHEALSIYLSDLQARS